MEEELFTKKLFSLEEANGLIPKLRPLIKKVTIESKALFGLQDEIKKARAKASLGSGSYQGVAYLNHLVSLTTAINAVEKTGVLVKDYNTGLCDFPHLKDGRIIYLCWKMDEKEIRYWHEVDAGFAGRQLI
ncbi:MAG: DUF2203 domain-containing protein [Acidobacteria bacterium]|nr:DUF2203 domain-containing protein [Acidobacteriota bacterium]